MKWLDKLENLFIATTILLAVLIVFINVVARAFWGGFSWANELVGYLLIWSAFIGSSVCIRTGNHVGITILPDFLKGNAKKMLIILFNLLMLVFSIGIFFWLGIQLMQLNYDSQQVSPALRLPLYIIYACLPLSGLLMAIRSIQGIIYILSRKPIKNPIDYKQEGIK